MEQLKVSKDKGVFKFIKKWVSMHIIAKRKRGEVVP